MVAAFGGAMVVTFNPHDTAFVWCAAVANGGVALAAAVTRRAARRDAGDGAATVHLLAGTLLGGLGLIGQLLLLFVVAGD